MGDFKDDSLVKPLPFSVLFHADICLILGAVTVLLFTICKMRDNCYPRVLNQTMKAVKEMSFGAEKVTLF